MEQQKRMSLKQFFISILLSLALFVVYLIGILPVFANQKLSIVLHAGISALICGPVYVLMIAKSRVPGTVFITNVIFALFYLIVGNIYLFVLMLAAGLIGELIMRKGGYPSQNRLVIPYIIMWIAVGLKNILMFGLFKDAVLNNYLRTGMDEESAKAAIDHASAIMLSIPLNLAGVAVTIIGGLLGIWLGKKAMKKYFAPAGIADENAN